MNASISRYERRDVASRNSRVRGSRVRGIVFQVGISITAVLALHLAMPILAAGPVEGKPVVYKDGKRGDLDTLCAQYRSDHLMTGLGMEQETAELCGFND